jgi:hypothetical protein
LRKRGWAVLRLWECQLKEAAQTLRIQKMLAKGDRLYRFVWAEVRDSALRYLMKNAGETFNLDDNVEILKINSPTAKVKGPYKVVAKGKDERWVIVALDYGNEPILGIRWFYGDGGHPTAHSYATWFNIPDELGISVLSGLKVDLKIDAALSVQVEAFLKGEITGEQLKG